MKHIVKSQNSVNKSEKENFKIIKKKKLKKDLNSYNFGLFSPRFLSIIPCIPALVDSLS